MPPPSAALPPPPPPHRMDLPAQQDPVLASGLLQHATSRSAEFDAATVAMLCCAVQREALPDDVTKRLNDVARGQ
jgi:hypothetical protein